MRPPLRDRDAEHILSERLSIRRREGTARHGTCQPGGPAGLLVCRNSQQWPRPAARNAHQGTMPTHANNPFARPKCIQLRDMYS